MRQARAASLAMALCLAATGTAITAALGDAAPAAAVSESNTSPRHVTPRLQPHDANVFVIVANKSDRSLFLRLDTGCIYGRGCSERGTGDKPVQVTIPPNRSIDIWGRTAAGTDLKGWMRWNLSADCPADGSSQEQACVRSYSDINLRWKRPSVGWSWMSVEGKSGTNGSLPLDERTFSVGQQETWPLWGKKGHIGLTTKRIQNFAGGTTVFRVEAVTLPQARDSHGNSSP